MNLSEIYSYWNDKSYYYGTLEECVKKAAKDGWDLNEGNSHEERNGEISICLLLKKAVIGRLERELEFKLGDFIRKRFGLDYDNYTLIEVVQMDPFRQKVWLAAHSCELAK